MKINNCKPFIKWAGGKSQLLPELSKFYPKLLGKEIRKYAEPFIGGGAVFFDILNTFELNEIYISDVNAALIQTYIAIRDDVGTLISLLNMYQNEFIPLDAANRKNYFYKKRELYNQYILSNNINTELASLFIFLNKTCFNGLYRVNSKGLYNVPMGDYKRPLICDVENLKSVSQALKKVYIHCANFEKSANFIDKYTFAYFDPPYRPLNNTSNFTSYSEVEFNDDKQIQLAKFIKKMADKGAYILASNADPKNADENDEFFDTLYKDFKIYRVPATRMINSIAQKRGKISELIISNIGA